MKKIITLFAIFFAAVSLNAQEEDFPDVTVRDMNGNSVNVQKLSTEGKTVAIAFWATWCGPCMLELNAISEKMDEWQDETDFQFYAISIDDSKTVSRVRPMVNGKGWDFDILLDTNQELQRRLNFATPPFTVIVKDGKIMYKHIGYKPGAEDNFYEKIKEFSN